MHARSSAVPPQSNSHEDSSLISAHPTALGDRHAMLRALLLPSQEQRTDVKLARCMHVPYFQCFMTPKTHPFVIGEAVETAKQLGQAHAGYFLGGANWSLLCEEAPSKSRDQEIFNGFTALLLLVSSRTVPCEWPFIMGRFHTKNQILESTVSPWKKVYLPP